LVNSEREQQEEPGASVPAGSSARRGDAEVVGRRVLASLIDCSLIALLSSAVFVPLVFARVGLVLVLVLLLLFVLLFCVSYVAYVAVFEGLWGQTLGKAVYGIEVIREEEGGVPGLGRSALRALIFLLADMIVGLFVMLASPKRQRPGDMAAGTLVVRKRRG
jgi:uncharacterized RDD family membrane protein YckC